MRFINIKILTILLFVLVFLYLLYTLLFSYIMLNHINKGKTLYSSGIYKSDPVLGIVGKQNSKGYIFFPGGDSIPVYTNGNGNRCLGLNNKIEKPGGILFIGDSFTFGDANEYANSFPVIISDSLKMPLTNASMVGYGLTQYLLLIEKLLKENLPEIIAIQISPYSASRAISGRLPAFVKIPTPLLEKKDNSYYINKPEYETNLFSLVEKVDMNVFKSERMTASLFLKFYFQIGLPLYSYEILNEGYSFFKKIGGNQKPTEEEAYNFFFKTLNDILLKHGKDVVPIFYNIGYNSYEFEAKMELLKESLDVEFLHVNFEKALMEQLTSDKDYYSSYGHWRGNPPVLVDKHYNSIAHKIVAYEFIRIYESNRINE